MEDFTKKDLDYINEPFNLSDKLYIKKMEKIKYGTKTKIFYKNKTPEEKKLYHKEYMQKRRAKVKTDLITDKRAKELNNKIKRGMI